MKRIGLIIIPILILGVVSLAGCEQKPEEVPEGITGTRPADPEKAVEIPESPVLVIPNELVVLLKQGQTLKSFQKTIANTNIKIVGYIKDIRVVQLEVPSNEREKIKVELKNNPVVEAVAYQMLFRANAAFNDPALTNDDPIDDWGLRAMNLEEAWKITQGDPSVIIAIIDGGTLPNHEEVEGKIVSPGSIFSEDGTQVGGAAELLHGTHVAIIAAGTAGNGLGTSGVAPGCKIMPVQVGGRDGMYTTDIMGGVAYAVKNGAKVINMSLAICYKESFLERYADPSQRADFQRRFGRERSETLDFVNEIFSAVEAKGVTVVVGAGNDNIPASFSAYAASPYSLTVGAVGLTKEGYLAPADFSNYGYMMDVSAPGVDIYSGIAEPEGHSYAFFPGTSMASPHAAGLAALIASKYPELKPSEIRKAIVGSAFGDTPADSPRLRWYQDNRGVNREMNSWRRAFLFLLGKDDSKLLDSHAWEFLMFLIPQEHRKIWDGAYPSLTGEKTKAGDKAVGPFIDARAALENAKNKTFLEQFAIFSNEEIKKATTINPQRLFHVYNLVKFSDRYAGSKETGGSFELTLKAPFKRLEVVRDVSPGEGYSEWFEFVTRDKFRHLCRFKGEDYSQGIVKLEYKDKKLRIKNLKRNEEYLYEKSASPGGQTTPSSFYTIVGGSEPNTIGELLIKYINPKDEPVNKEFLVYPAGALAVIEEVVFAGLTGKTNKLLTGRYDIKILSEPVAIWFKDVEIKEDEAVSLEAGGYGKILIKANNSSGEPIRRYFWMYAPEDTKKESVVAKGSTSELADVVSGRYDIYISLQGLGAPQTVYKAVEIKRGQTTEINIPQPGRLIVKSLDPAGELLKENLWVYKSNNKDDTEAIGYTNKPLDLPAGIYFINVWGNRDIENVEIKSGQTTEVTAPPK